MILSVKNVFFGVMALIVFACPTILLADEKQCIECHKKIEVGHCFNI